MALPEDCQQLLVGDLLGVVIHLDGFGVVAQVCVRRVLFGSAGIADSGADDSLYQPELGFDTPESAQSERGGFIVLRRCRIDRRYGHGCVCGCVGLHMLLLIQ